MNDLILLLFLVDAVLCIILFVKIWGMTGDVRRLEKRFSYECPLKEKFADLYLCGEYEEAYKLLNNFLVKVIAKRFSTQSRNEADFKKSFADDIGTLIGRYSRYYKMIGKEIPENIRNVTFDSYNELV